MNKFFLEEERQDNVISVFTDLDGSEEKFVNVEISDVLPILPLRNMVLFPGVVIPVSLGRKSSVEPFHDASGIYHHWLLK